MTQFIHYEHQYQHYAHLLLLLDLVQINALLKLQLLILLYNINNNLQPLLLHIYGSLTTALIILSMLPLSTQQVGALPRNIFSNPTFSLLTISTTKKLITKKWSFKLSGSSVLDAILNKVLTYSDHWLHFAHNVVGVNCLLKWIVSESETM